MVRVSLANLSGEAYEAGAACGRLRAVTAGVRGPRGRQERGLGQGRGQESAPEPA